MKIVRMFPSYLRSRHQTMFQYFLKRNVRYSTFLWYYVNRLSIFPNRLDCRF
jgi:hypothetical protein